MTVAAWISSICRELESWGLKMQQRQKGSRMTWAHIQWPEPPVKSWIAGQIVIVEATKTHLRKPVQSNKTWLRSTAFHLCVGIFFCNLRCSIYHLAFYFTYTSLHLAFTYNNTHVKIDNLNIFLAIWCRILQPPFPWSCQLIDKMARVRGTHGYGDTVTGYCLNLAGDTEMDVSKNSGFSPKSSILIGKTPLFSPSILGYPYFWKHPFWNPQLGFQKSKLRFLLAGFPQASVFVTLTENSQEDTSPKSQGSSGEESGEVLHPPSWLHNTRQPSTYVFFVP